MTPPRHESASEAGIQRLLYWEYVSGSQLIVPNFTSAAWWEADLWRLTRAGYSDEFEIKLSRSDYRADARKLGKHRQLSEGSLRGPNRFWFVSPDNIIQMDDLPEWAGLLHVEPSQRVVCIRRAPQLHKQKVPDRVLKMARRALCYRFWTLFPGMADTGARKVAEA